MSADAGQPLYQRIAAYVREGILTCRYTRYVPSQSSLTREFKCGDGTIDRAMSVLRDDGMIGTMRSYRSRVLVRPYPFGSDGRYVAVLAQGQRKLFCTSCWQPVNAGGTHAPDCAAAS